MPSPLRSLSLLLTVGLPLPQTALLTNILALLLVLGLLARAHTPLEGLLPTLLGGLLQPMQLD